MTRILLVEDDPALAYGVQYALKKEGFNITVCKSIKEAREKIKEDFDLMLLDIMLTDGNGYDFCGEVRANSNIPIIFMSALEEEVNIVLGLDIGGDDYITKPVRIKELVSRINAVLRRRNKENTPKPVDSIMSGDVTIEVLKGKIWLRGKELVLTPIEYRLLLLFIENRGIVLSRDGLLEKLWDVHGNFVESNTINVYIKRLREKLEDDIGQPRYIKTVRGIGYKWSEEVKGVDVTGK